MSGPVRIVHLSREEKVYSPEELRDIFSRFAMGDPVAVALRQIVQQRFVQAATDASEVNLSERAAGHAGGRVQEITDFHNELLGYFGLAETPVGEAKPAPRKKK